MFVAESTFRFQKCFVKFKIFYSLNFLKVNFLKITILLALIVRRSEVTNISSHQLTMKRNRNFYVLSNFIYFNFKR